MTRIHQAQIRWTEQHVQLSLSSMSEMKNPAWFLTDGPPEGWSLVCRFAAPPSVQGDPSRAEVEFLFDAAPHARLRPGVELRMFEPVTKLDAHVIILD